MTLANSHFGSLAIDFLLKEVPAKDIIATVRDLKKGEKFKSKGIEVRLADYSKQEKIARSIQRC